MTLSKPSRPEYSTTLPSTGKKIKYQSFTVREEKILILAASSEDKEEIANAVDNVLTKCITSPSGINVRDLALFDIEYLFLKARSKSIGETVNLDITDPNDPTFTAEYKLNFDTVRVKTNSKHTDLIDIDDNTKLKMRYPGLEFFAEGLALDSLDDCLDTIATCVSSIVEGDEVIQSADLEKEKINEWLEGLTTKQFNKVMEFFSTMPKLTHTIKLTNTNTGNQFEVVLTGLADFFQQR